MLLKAELMFGNMVKAVTRQLGDHAVGKLASREFLEIVRALRLRRLRSERVMIRLVGVLPVCEWWTSHRGMGPLGLAQVLAITGDLNRYATPAKLWKFMSLHVVAGRAARKVSGELAKAQGFSPARRMVMHQIGEAVVKLNRDGLYRKLYLARKDLELVKLADQRSRKNWSHRRALRYMEKRILLDLWRAWRLASEG
jgi:hypothetical protein